MALEKEAASSPAPLQDGEDDDECEESGEEEADEEVSAGGEPRAKKPKTSPKVAKK